MRQVLKGRYFHDGDFVSCSRRRCARHTWRAILAGIDVLKKGLIKRVCNGVTTRIWCDRWLPGHFAGYPLTPAEGQVVEMVSDLITDSGAGMKDLSGISFFLSTQMQSFECHYVLEGRIFGHGRKKGAITTLSSRLTGCRKTCVRKVKVIRMNLELHRKITGN